MKTVLGAMMCAALLGLAFADSYAAEQRPDEMIVAMASSKTVCGGNTGKACPGTAPARVSPPVATTPAIPAPKPLPAPVPQQPAPVTVPQQLAPSSTVPSAPTTAVVPSAPVASTPLAATVTPSTTGLLATKAPALSDLVVSTASPTVSGNRPPVPSSANGGTTYCVSTGANVTILAYNPGRVIKTIPRSPCRR